MKTTNFYITILIVPFSIIILSSCSEKSVLIDDHPPGLVFLQNNPADEDFDSLIERSVIESELFRRKVLAGNDPDFINPELLAAAIREFCYKATPYLKGRYNIESFSLTEDELVKSIEGKSSLFIEEAYNSFTGKWFGKWDQMDVNPIVFGPVFAF